MRKKALVLGTLFSATLLTTGGVTVFAQGTGTEADPAQATATIKFEENDQPTGPVDPTDPTQPAEPDDNNNTTEAAGPLSLDVYPNSFDFGTQKLNLNGGTYASTKTGNHYLQITDNRDAVAGWTLSVGRTEFSDGTNQLTGSGLYIPAGTARNSLASDPTAAATNITVNSAISTGDFAGMYEISTTTSSLFGAKDDLANLVGKGTTTYTWDAAGEKLSIPAGVAKQGTFTSTVNWTLTATPMS